MTSPPRILSITTVLVVLVVLGFSVWWRLEPGAEDDGQAFATGITAEVEVGSQLLAETSQPVTGAAVVRDTLWITVGAGGQAETIARARLKAQVTGVLQELPARENGTVAAGEMVLRLDTVELALQVASAEAQLAQAENDFEARVLFDEEEPDPETRRSREAAAFVASGRAEAEVQLRRRILGLERATVRAPFDGRVADLVVVVGQHLSAGADLMTVVDLDPIKVEAEVLEADIGMLREGRRAMVSFAALPGERFTGRIESINPLVDPERRTGRVAIHLSNPEHRIKPGMYAHVRLDAEAVPDRILVPRAAVLERGEGRRRKMLFVYQGDETRGVARWEYVVTGRENERFVEIVPSEETNPVQPGWIVLVDGHHYLAHAAPVRLVADLFAESGRQGG